MATAIIYASKSGSTEKAAQMLSKQIKGSEIFNIDRDAFDLAKFDAVIIGSFVRMGMFDKKIRKLVLKYGGILSEKKLGFFMCGMMPENEKQYWSNNFPPQIVEKAQTAHFGGELDIDNLHGMDKRIAKLVEKENQQKGIFKEFSINENAIKEFGKRFNENGIS